MKWDPASIAHNGLNFLCIVRNTWGPDGRRSEPPQFPKFAILFRSLMPRREELRLQCILDQDRLALLVRTVRVHRDPALAGLERLEKKHDGRIFRSRPRPAARSFGVPMMDGAEMRSPVEGYTPSGFGYTDSCLRADKSKWRQNLPGLPHVCRRDTHPAASTRVDWTSRSPSPAAASPTGDGRPSLPNVVQRSLRVAYRFNGETELVAPSFAWG